LNEFVIWAQCTPRFRLRQVPGDIGRMMEI